MGYPTKEQIEAADRRQICEWYRFLPSPGTTAIDSGLEAFDKAMAVEAELLDLIGVRFRELGGMTPAISKQLGR